MTISSRSDLPTLADGSVETCIRDMMGMVGLPALWAGRGGRDILHIMSEAIGRVVAFDFCFIEVVLNADEPAYTLARVRSGLPQTIPMPAWSEAARGWSAARVPDGRAFMASSPLGTMRVLGLSMGFGTHAGKIWYGAGAPSFPSHHQLALLRVATSLATTGLQAARVNEEREQASRAKDEFLAMLAHELRNPLAPISAAAELLTLTEPDRERVRATAAVISRQARHMSGLIDDLLDVSRVTRGLVVLEEQALDLSRVVAEAVEQVRPLVDARRHRLALELPPHPVSVTGDHKRLVQAVSNVLNNAAKYTPHGGNILVRLAQQDDMALITISDDGIGMTPDLVKRAFDLFTQAQRTADRSQGGLGIGLALVKSLVELHHGTVSARSDGPGLGSVITLSLPRTAQAAPGPAVASRPGAQPRTASRRVMIVDDNVDAARMLATVLDTFGHAIHVEHDAHAALEAAPRVAPQVFLLDLGLPGIDGYEMARRLRASPATRDATLVAITGYGGEQDRRRSALAGFDHHFAKPVDLDALAALLAQAPDAS